MKTHAEQYMIASAHTETVEGRSRTFRHPPDVRCVHNHAGLWLRIGFRGAPKAWVRFLLAVVLLCAAGELLAASFVGSLNLNRIPRKIVAEGKYAYVLTDTNLTIIDISDPVYPLVVGRYYPSGVPVNMAIAGNRAFLVIDGFGLRIVDVKDAPRLVEIGALPTKCRINDIAVTGAYVLLLDTSGIHSIDVGDGTHPVERGYYRTRHPNDGFQQFLTISNEHAFVTGSSGFSLLDISDMSNPKEIKYYKITTAHSDKPLGLAVYGNYAYRVENKAFLIFDFSIDSHEIQCSYSTTYSEIAERNRCALSGNYMYALIPYGIQIFDLTRPLHPQPLFTNFNMNIGGYSFPPEQSLVLALTKNHALIGDERKTLTIVDLSPPVAGAQSDTSFSSTDALKTNVSRATNKSGWDESKLEGMKDLPRKVSRTTLLDLVKPGGLKPGEELESAWAGRCFLRPNMYLVEMKIRSQYHVHDWVAVLSISKETGEVVDVARPVKGYLELSQYIESFCFSSNPTRIGMKDYALCFEASFYNHWADGSEDPRTKTFFCIRNGLLVPVFGVTLECLGVRRVSLADTNTEEGEERYEEKGYENYNSWASYEFSEKMTNGYFDLIVHRAHADERYPEDNKEWTDYYTWDCRVL
jgi:hypothetical protein